MSLPRIILTSGEPAGIGPDLCLELARQAWDCELVFAGDIKVFRARAAQLGSPVAIVEVLDPTGTADILEGKGGTVASVTTSATHNEVGGLRTSHRDSSTLKASDPTSHSRGDEPAAADKSVPPPARTARHESGVLRVIHRKAAARVVPGKLDAANSRYVLELLDVAIAGCLAGDYDAMVTAPVQKSIIMEAGIPFTGHTEYLADKTGAELPVMMLAAGTFRVALATIHLPLQAVSAHITQASLQKILHILHLDLQRWFGLQKPRIVVCGLNPHAGESGHLGREEIDVIAPALRAARAQGLNVTGPLPADTVFTPRHLDTADVVLAMYHDQGLPVLKYAGFGHAINVTLGLPIIRTSVDHGTALDLAGTGRAEVGSLAAALTLAIDMAKKKKIPTHVADSNPAGS